MQTGNVQAYTLQMRYEQQAVFFQRDANVNGAGAKTQSTELFAASRTFEFTMEIQGESSPQFKSQAAVADFLKGLDVDWQAQAFEGRPIYDLSPDEAADLISEDGYWGVTKTAQRLADFVLTGGGNDLDRLRAGRAGILKGLDEAEKVWGGQLPEISYKTMEAALTAIDDKIRQLGGSVVDTMS